jgi:hypothetical protein
MRGGNLICFQSEKPGSIAFHGSCKLQAVSRKRVSADPEPDSDSKKHLARTGRPVAARLAGGGDLQGATPGKPNCYRQVLAQSQFWY